jgi:hypothetical protein
VQKVCSAGEIADSPMNIAQPFYPNRRYVSRQVDSIDEGNQGALYAMENDNDITH